jgi:hypothetical protein
VKLLERMFLRDSRTRDVFAAFGARIFGVKRK